MKRSMLVLCGSALLAAASCKSGTEGNGGAPAGDVLQANLDTAVNPADDFFDYANGGWIRKNPIPDDEKSWGIAYLVQEDLYKRLKAINEQAVSHPDNPVSKKIAAFWKSGMDSVRINQQALSGIRPELDMIGNITDISGLMAAAAELNRKGVRAMFGSYVGQDDMNSDKMALMLYQGGIGLPNRDYYFNMDDRTKKIRDAYPGHIERMFNLAALAPLNETKARSEAVMKLETRLARASRKLADLRDPYKNYNKLAVTEMKKLTPDIDWAQWLHMIGVEQPDTVIVGQPEYFRELNAALKAEPIGVWKDYLRWCLVRELSAYLSAELEEANFSFYESAIKGAKKQKPRWKRVLAAEESAMGEALGQLFVKEYFNEKARQRYSDMVEDIRNALKERIKKLEWMSPATKEKALVKLAKMKKKVGYPDKWKDFSAMDIKDQPYVRNVIAANEWWHRYNVHKLGRPVDRDEWSMTPQTYNAYYNPSNNEIVLPAGIFTVPGRRDEELDDALVYGYAGASTIGHEITHGFDDQGRQYDENGNLKNWWTKEDELNFNMRAALMVTQFNNYMPIDSMHINGSATLGENIADLGGVLLGWDAFVMKEQYKKGGKIAGLDPGQRYFLGYALGWLYNISDKSLANQLLTDVHSPAKYRVNGPFSDVDAFYQVFKVTPANKMYIPDSLRVRIW